MAMTQTAQWFQRLPRNDLGRDYCVGDLHGMFPLLEHALAQLAFDPACDRLISVGDLIDRGPESAKVGDFLALPWVHAVRGNHEQMLLDSETDAALEADWVMGCGGEWWPMLPAARRERCRRAIAALPYALEIETRRGRVGVVHADVPHDLSWSQFLTCLARDEDVRDHALWSRTRIGRVRRGEQVPAVPGIDLLVCGHTPLSEPRQAANVHFIDTGAVYAMRFKQASLTLLELQPDWRVHSFPAAPAGMD
ncbi:metallophosphoesterase [Acidihalobacter prosperus]|uniref:Phosphoprotein phosphatase n=1 Tax=Acidihalobacter prosperus TaxID=160660 RepID=A0A1A6C874_9GAMM|nr:metallophosphoesterase [Acidihalobacter prosperus]OBS10767.1 phosphoprotein phosphatase [Acidihalobacter prosperus]